MVADWAVTHFLYSLHTLLFIDLHFMHICKGQHALKSLQPLFWCTYSTVKSSALSLSVYLQQLCVSCKDNMVSTTSPEQSLFSLPYPLPFFKTSRKEISLPGKHNEPVVKLATLQGAKLKKKKKKKRTSNTYANELFAMPGTSMRGIKH